MMSYLIARDTMHQDQWLAAWEELGGREAHPIPTGFCPGRTVEGGTRQEEEIARDMRLAGTKWGGTQIVTIAKRARTNSELFTSHRGTDMSLKTLKDLYVHELKDLYSAEKQLTEALPEMVDAANSPQLREAFASHLKETEQHLKKVHRLLQELNENPGSSKCKAMEGLLEEGEDAVEEEASPAVRDAFLIAAAQRVEHYEISGYGTARAYAQALGREADAKVLNQVLDQEYAADDKLGELAEAHINEAAKRG